MKLELSIYQYCFAALSLSIPTSLYLTLSPSLSTFERDKFVCLAKFGCYMKSNYQITKVRTLSFSPYNAEIAVPLIS